MKTSAHPKFSDGDQQDLFNEAVGLGWTWRKGGSGHVVMRPSKGEGYMSLSTTRVGTRAVLNNRAGLLRWKKQQGIA